MTTERAAFAARLSKLLAKKKLPASPVELAALLARHGASVTPQKISGWINGTFMPRIGNLRALAKLLDVSLLALQENEAAPQARGVKESAPGWTVPIEGKDAIAFREFSELSAAHRKLVRELIAALASAGANAKRG